MDSCKHGTLIHYTVPTDDIRYNPLKIDVTKNN